MADMSALSQKKPETSGIAAHTLVTLSACEA